MHSRRRVGAVIQTERLVLSIWSIYVGVFGCFLQKTTRHQWQRVNAILSKWNCGCLQSWPPGRHQLLFCDAAPDGNERVFFTLRLRYPIHNHSSSPRVALQIARLLDRKQKARLLDRKQKVRSTLHEAECLCDSLVNSNDVRLSSQCGYLSHYS